MSGGRLRAGAAVVAIGAALATLGGGAGAAHAATCDTSWAAPVDGLFDQAQNWTNGVPTVTDAACLPSFAPAYQVTIRDNRSAAASLSIGGNVGVRLIDGPSGARFQAPGGIQNDGIFDVATQHGAAYDLELGSSTFVNDGNLVAETPLTVSALDNPGRVVASSDLTLGALAQLGGGLLTRGILQIDSGGSLQLPQDVTTVGGGAVVLLAGALTDPAGSPALGQLAQISGSLLVETPLHTAASTLRNHGFLELASTLSLAGTYLQDGPILGLDPGGRLAAPGHAVEVDAGQMYLAHGSAIDGNVTSRAQVELLAGSGSPAAIDGTFKQSRQGSLLVDANGGGVGALAVSGSVTAAGPLTVSSPNLPPSGRYAVLTTPGFVGSFKLHPAFGETLTTSHTEIDLAVAATANADDPAVAYGGWTVVTTALATGGQVHESETAGDTASVTLPDLSAWDSIAREDGGLVDVLVDGAYVETDNTHATDRFKLDLPGLHTLTLRVAGAHGDGSTGNVVDVDAIEVGGNRFDDGQLTYDGWAPAETTGGTLYRLASAATRPASYAFSGTSVSWVTQTGPDRGQAAVQIDGVTVKNVNLFSATEKDGVLKTYAGLAAGSHTIAIVPLGKHSRRSTGDGVAVQAFLSS